eukprot:6491642-Amphidinium_carterae.7
MNQVLQGSSLVQAFRRHVMSQRKACGPSHTRDTEKEFKLSHLGIYNSQKSNCTQRVAHGSHLF